VASKQVLVMRKFIGKGSRIGKYVAQGAHASVGALFSLGAIDKEAKEFVIDISNPFVYEWVVGNFRKITCYVETDQELTDIYIAARSAGIACSIIEDSGLTEFNGVKTLTAIGVGPADEELINKLTGHLPLF